MSVEDLFGEKLLSQSPWSISEVTPALAVQVYSQGEKILNFYTGSEYKCFDLASLTKTLFTVTCWMHIYEEDKDVLKMDVGEILGWDRYLGISTQDLLTHRSGLPAWKPYYKESFSGDYCKRRQKLALLLQSEVPRKSHKATYSDIGFMVLGFVMEILCQRSLLELWDHQKIFWPTGHLHFLTNRKESKKYAPTFSHQLGKKYVKGWVNDANTQALGGVSTHAGLFGVASDVGQWLMHLRKIYLGKERKNLSKDTVSKFMKRSMPRECGDWALGFMKPSVNGSSGSHFTDSSIGHLGFTGTSFWWDYKKDWAVVIIANRYIDKYRGEEFKKLRPLIHDLAWEVASGS